jgi:hypothetical protein
MFVRFMKWYIRIAANKDILLLSEYKLNGQSDGRYEVDKILLNHDKSRRAAFEGDVLFYHRKDLKEFDSREAAIEWAVMEAL